jgi:hypothetical protein
MSLIKEKDQQILQNLTQIIEGFIPICANCKSIRNEGEDWKSIESFIAEHSKNVKFSHGLCPSCLKKLYPELLDEKDK